MSIVNVLRDNQLCNLHPRTAKNWLLQLGYQYLPQKTYYNDKHENIKNISHCHQFIKIHFECEILCHRWIQLPLSEYIKLRNEGEIFCDKGYKYKNKKGKTIIEFNVNNSSKCIEIRQKPFWWLPICKET